MLIIEMTMVTPEGTPVTVESQGERAFKVSAETASGPQSWEVQIQGVLDSTWWVERVEGSGCPLDGPPRWMAECVTEFIERTKETS
jgi:hypothetical protein